MQRNVKMKTPKYKWKFFRIDGSHSAAIQINLKAPREHQFM